MAQSGQLTLSEGENGNSPSLRDPDHLSLRVGMEGRTKAESLTRLAGYEKMNQFYKALINHLSDLADDKPFDIRNLVFKEANQPNLP